MVPFVVDRHAHSDAVSGSFRSRDWLQTFQ